MINNSKRREFQCEIPGVLAYIFVVLPIEIIIIAELTQLYMQFIPNAISNQSKAIVV